jgi:hypothetical protein
MSFIFHPQTWRPIIVHKVGEDIAKAIISRDGTDQAKVLTLSPIYPLEADLEIYPEFATGVFAWRSAPYLDSEQLVEFGIISEENINAYLEKSSPEAILVGLQPDLENAFIEYATQNGYIAEEVGSDLTLWLR